MFWYLFAVSFHRVAIVTGGSRGIGAGISKALARDGFDILLTYNSNESAAMATVQTLKEKYGRNAMAVGGDIALRETHDKIFETLDEHFGDGCLATVVHNAGQYIGITSENSWQLRAETKCFGDGSLCNNDEPDLRHMRYYNRLYGEAFVELLERSIPRMRNGGSLIGISSPGCTQQYKPNLGYDMPGSGKCVMEYAMRLYATRTSPNNINCNVIIPGASRRSKRSPRAHAGGRGRVDACRTCHAWHTAHIARTRGVILRNLTRFAFCVCVSFCSGGHGQANAPSCRRGTSRWFARSRVRACACTARPTVPT